MSKKKPAAAVEPKIEEPQADAAAAVDAPDAADAAEAADAPTDPAEDAPADAPAGHASAVVTGPQSCIVTGTDAQALAEALDKIREHGGQISAEDGSVVRGPITGEAPLDELRVQIMVAFPIEPAADANA